MNTIEQAQFSEDQQSKSSLLGSRHEERPAVMSFKELKKSSKKKKKGKDKSIKKDPASDLFYFALKSTHGSMRDVKQINVYDKELPCVFVTVQQSSVSVFLVKSLEKSKFDVYSHNMHAIFNMNVAARVKILIGTNDSQKVLRLQFNLLTQQFQPKSDYPVVAKSIHIHDYMAIDILPAHPQHLLSIGSQKDTTIKLWEFNHQYSQQKPSVYLDTKKLSHNSYARSQTDLFSVATWTSQICVYNISKAKVFQKFSILTGHKSQVICLGLSSDGKYLISASLDKTIKLWNVGNDIKIGGDKLLTTHKQILMPNAIAVEHLIDPRFQQQVQKKGKQNKTIIAVAVYQKISIFTAKFPDYKLFLVSEIEDASMNKIKHLRFCIDVEGFNQEQKTNEVIYLMASGLDSRINIFKVNI